MGILSTLKVKLIADIADYADKMREARARAGEVNTGLGTIGDGLRNMGGSLANIATVAAGQLLATGVTKLAGAFVGAGREAVASVADYERLGASLTALTAKEIFANGVKTQSIATGQVAVALTAKESEARADLAIKVRDLGTDIQVAQDRLNKSIQTGKLSQAEITDRRQAIEALQRRQNEASASLAMLDQKAGRTVTAYKAVTTETMTMADAQALAASKVNVLLDWVQKLAVESPFTRADVASAFKMAMAYGFTSDQAKDLTQATIDFASATGATGDTMARITLALGQMKAKGRVMGGELLQLTEAGVGTNEILREMGYTLKDVEAGSVDAGKFIDAFTKKVGRDFGGAAKAQSGTFSGLLSSLEDLKDIALRNVFTPLFMAFKPVLTEIVNLLQSPVAQQFFEGIGEALAKPVRGLGLFRTLVEQGISPIEALRSVIASLLGGDALATFDNIRNGIQNAFQWIADNRQTLETVFAAIVGGIAAIAAVFAVANISAAFTAIAATIGGISLPIVAIVAAVALLAAAWQADFGGIRTTLTQVWEGTLRPALEQLWAWLQVNIPLAIAAVAQFWETKLRPALEAVGLFIQTNVVPAFVAVGDWLSVNIPLAIQAVVGFWNNTLQPALIATWEWLETHLFPTLDSFANLMRVVIAKAVEVLAALWENTLQPALKAIWQWLVVNLTPAWNEIKKAIDAFMPVLDEFLKGAWAELKKGLEFVESLLREVKRIFDGFAQSIANFTLPESLTRHSPSPLEQTFMGVRDSLQAIHRMGMPDWGAHLPPAFALPGAGGAWDGGGRDVNMDIQIGALGDGLDLVDTARALGREVARRLR